MLQHIKHFHEFTRTAQTTPNELGAKGKTISGYCRNDNLTQRHIWTQANPEHGSSSGLEKKPRFFKEIFLGF